MIITPDNFTLVATDALIFLAVFGMGLLLALQPRSKTIFPKAGGIVALAGVFLAASLNVIEFMPAGPHGTAPTSGLQHWFYWFLSRFAILLIGIGLYIAYRERTRMHETIRASTRQAESIRDRLLASEYRFRHLLETTTNSVYCYTFDPPISTDQPVEEQMLQARHAVMTECNNIYARQVRAEQSSADSDGGAEGADGLWERDEYQQLFRIFVEAGYRLADFEVSYELPNGEERAVRTSLTGIIQEGYLHRIWGMESDVLDFRRTRKALRRRHDFQELLSKVSTALIMARNEEVDDVIQQTLEHICRYFDANRFSVGWADLDSGVTTILYRWQDSDGPQIPDRISLPEFPRLGSMLYAGQPFRANDVGDLPEEMAIDAQRLHELGLKALMFQPMLVAGDVLGTVALANDARAVEWSDRSLQELKVLADLFANFILRLRQRRALDKALADVRAASERLEAENVYLRNEIKLDHDFEEIIGQSSQLREALQLVEQVADTMTPVLILGETGTGKELVARALHEHSRRRDRPLVKVNCATLPADLIESELFGFEKGAFTGATSAKRGRFDLADGSTLFLDEIAELPIQLQPKLLRVLQEGEFERLGGTETIKVEVRIVAATNCDMWEAVADGRFRADLLYRINTYPIELPPLRERGDDVRMLAEHFARLHAQRLNREVTAISADMIAQLEAYEWPGNVRELEGVIQRALISTTGPILEIGRSLSARAASGPGSKGDTGRRVAPDLKSVEREHIVAVLDAVSWKISGDSGAAAKLGVPPSTLRSKMKKLDIRRPAT